MEAVEWSGLVPVDEEPGSVNQTEAEAGPVPEAPSLRLLPPPSDPMAVARQFVGECYTTSDDDLVLRTHRGDFYRWDETCWPEAEARGVRGDVYRWLESAFYLKETRAGPVPTAWQPTRYKVDNVLDALRAVSHLDGTAESPSWICHADDVPADQIIAVKNGLLHLPTRTLQSHTPRLWTHHSLPFAFDEDAPEPVKWLAFLNELWDTDKDSVATLQEIFGYILGGETCQQKLFLVVGPKRGGKGTIARVLTGILGRHNVAAPTLASLATNFGLQPMIGRPLGLISDPRLSGRSDRSIVVERLLSISGEDSLTVDRKYRDPWTGRLPTRLLILTNELPKLADSSGALSSRFIVLVLTKSFYGREDPKLTDKLLEEATGILNWALDGYDRLMERGYFLQPVASIEAIQLLEDLVSPIGAFVRECCVVGADHAVEVESLWEA